MLQHSPPHLPPGNPVRHFWVYSYSDTLLFSALVLPIICVLWGGQSAFLARRYHAGPLPLPLFSPSC